MLRGQCFLGGDLCRGGGGLTAGCRAGDGGHGAGAWRGVGGQAAGACRWGTGRWAVETLCHRDTGAGGCGPGPKARRRARRPLRREAGRRSGCLHRQTSLPGLGPPVGATMGSRLPHASPPAGLLPFGLKTGQIMRDWRKRRDCEERDGGGTTRAARQGVSEAPVPPAIQIKGHSHSTFFSSIAK